MDVFDWLLEVVGIKNDKLCEWFLLLYWELFVYFEVVEVLIMLKLKGIVIGILLNGLFEMLKVVVGLVDIGKLLDVVMLVEDVGVYKFYDLVYEMVESCFVCEWDDVLFVLVNGWDVVGVVLYGFKIVWINCKLELVDKFYGIFDYVLSDLKLIIDLI